MSTDYFANGAYGILLSSYEAKLGDLPERINAAAEAAVETSDEDGMPVDLRNDAVRRFVPALRKTFARLGIIVPAQAHLLSTGDEDDRPGRCNVSYEEWVLGFGIFCRPDKIPKLHPSFIKAANHHTWVTCGCQRAVRMPPASGVVMQEKPLGSMAASFTMIRRVVCTIVAATLITCVRHVHGWPTRSTSGNSSL